MNKTATIKIEGDVLVAFDKARDHMISQMPGIAPNNADVLRHSLLMYSKTIDPVITEEGTPA